jgi:type VI protein secretion system component Hcp
MARYTFSLLIALIALVALSFTRPTTIHYYASIKGHNQGLLRAGFNSPGGRETQGWIEIYSFSIGASNPSTTPGKAAGGKEGKSSISSIVITKKTDGISQSLYNMLTSNEIIDSIIIQTTDDQQRVAKTTVVKNGRIKEIKKNGNNEIISILFAQIEEK